VGQQAARDRETEEKKTRVLLGGPAEQAAQLGGPVGYTKTKTGPIGF